MKLKINGGEFEVGDEPDMPLLWAIREMAGLSGTKFACGRGLCGACTVHLDGNAVRSCVLPVAAAEGREITTIEGLAEDGEVHPVQQAWIEENVAQCGYCQSGQVMAAAAFIKGNPDPSNEEIKQSIVNICRCGTYPSIAAAIKRAAEKMGESE